MILPQKHAVARLVLGLVVGCLQLFSISAFASVSLPDFTALVESSTPAIVNISTTQKAAVAAQGMPFDPGAQPPGADSEMFREFLRRFLEQQQGMEVPQADEDLFDSASSGSGFVIDKDGYVVTNFHVVKDADEILVRLSDRRVFVADLVGSDVRSDIALLKIDAADLPVLTLGSSDKLKAGEWVLAIGSPFGFEHSVTAGIVSATGRSLPSENYVPFIQTDVAINPGNSGGPLFNMAGEVVGINSQIYSRTGGFMGLSFAIPIEVAMDVVGQLKSKGTVTRGWLGVYIQEVTRELAESFGLDKTGGALVAQVIEGSPAEKAKIEVGDIILAFNGELLDSSAALPAKVGMVPPGEVAVVTLMRNGEQKKVEITIEELPDDGSNQAGTEKTSAKVETDTLGLTLVALDEKQKEETGLESGLVVNKVSPGVARKAGVIAGDVVVKFNGKSMDSVEMFADAVKDLPADKPVPMLIYRNGSPVFLAVKPEESDAK